MREIKFRAISISNDISLGDWVYGTFYKTKNDYYMVEELTGSHVKIDPETIGQYIGLKVGDVEIYEGDIVKHDNGTQFVEYDLALLSYQMGLSNHVCDQEVGVYDEVKVIGNIHENPDLIKEQQ